MRILIFTITALMNSTSWACDIEASNYLKEAREIAKELPQTDFRDGGSKYGDEHWINSNRTIEGGYRYLLHDIAIQFAKAHCWEDASITLHDIENAGKGVVRELVRSGRLEDGKNILKGAGLFDNHYESFFYNHTMNLARSGFYKEALSYVSRRRDSNDHVRNARGDMLLLFQERGEFELAEEVASYYDDNAVPNPPNENLTIYYAKTGRYTKANEYLEKITSNYLKVSMYFVLADSSKGKTQFITGKEISRRTKKNWKPLRVKWQKD